MLNIINREPAPIWEIESCTFKNSQFQSFPCLWIHGRYGVVNILNNKSWVLFTRTIDFCFCSCSAPANPPFAGRFQSVNGCFSSFFLASLSWPNLMLYCEHHKGLLIFFYWLFGELYCSFCFTFTLIRASIQLLSPRLICEPSIGFSAMDNQKWSCFIDRVKVVTMIFRMVP